MEENNPFKPPAELVMPDEERVEVEQFTGIEYLQGIGGWLILVIINIGFTIFGAGFMLFTMHIPFLLDPSEFQVSFHPNMRVILIYETCVNFFLIIFSIFALVVMFKKSRWFPKMMIGYYTFIFLNLLIDIILIESVSPSDGAFFPVFRTALYGGIWASYMLVSKRVKATFIK